ncbi:equilibrative nucleoside transporter 3 [Lepisosteus oculatus]|uniref:equilibrative nucleoside transporter 3 n=1 Tax=Lepisosteus oculatus TaxID=7918 RepID=UPI003719DC72
MEGSETLQASVNSSYLNAAESLDDDQDPLLPSEAEASPRFPGTQRPHDSYNLVYAIFFLLGVGSLLPWNFFITAKHYWVYKLTNASGQTDGQVPRSNLSDYFESYLSIASTVPSVLCLVLNFLLVNKVSPAVRVLSSLAVILLVFMVTTVLVKIDTTERREEFFVVTLVSVAVVSGTSNIFTGSVFGVTGRFPMRISQALISGQAMGGTLSAVASLIDLAAAHDITDSALAYFLTADVFILLCIFAYLLLPHLHYSRYYMLPPPCGVPGNDGACAEDQQARDTGGVPPLRPILKKTAVLGLCVFYVFFISIMVFPAISSGIQSVHKESGSPWTNEYFVPLTSFFLYNAADFCGRQATAWVQVPGPRSRLLPSLVLLRTALVPLFMFCNYQPRDHLQTVFFAQDVYPVVFISLLGLTNGYLGTLPMIYGPKVVRRDLAEAAGVVMSFFLMLGLAIGSAFSILIVHSI